ncbi:MAG TPA: alanine--glyoxylate aminotransferase family protein [Clostridiaceae bacterium]|nr:alanine--glyoxylate aminotransferase family protein [Clostridiaceae bacterium]
MHKKLFIPGPVEVAPDVLAKMATPMVGHRSQDATALQKSISEKLQKLMFTENTILLSTSSGTGLMEAAIRCCTRKRAAVFSVGSFGDRWYEIAKFNNIEADKFSSEPGQPTTPEMVEEALKTGKYDVVTVQHNETSSGIMNPVQAIGEVVKKYDDVLFLVDAVSSLGGAKIEVDAWGIDICITSTQKCLGLPPGLSLCSISDRAYEAAKQKEFRGFYLDLVKLYDRVKKSHQYPSTPSLSHMFALDYQLDRIINEEGIENRFDRHTKLANILRAWAEKHFSLFAAPECRSNTVTCINNTINFDFADLNKKLAERGFTISNGYGKFKDITFRIATMAECKEKDLLELLGAIDDILGLEI